MKDVSENTVSSGNQLPRTTSKFYLGREDAPYKVLVVGNSITRHAPSAGIGWHGDWGMAASDAEHDFVHLLFNKLLETGKDTLMMVRQAATWERGHMNENALSDFLDEHNFKPDVLVYRIGENVKELENFYEHMSEFVEFISQGGKVIMTSTVWKSEKMNPLIKQLADERGYVYLDLTAVGGDDKYMATGKFEHRGVAMHPGDLGMEYIASKIFDEILKLN